MPIKSLSMEGPLAIGRAHTRFTLWSTIELDIFQFKTVEALKVIKNRLWWSYDNIIGNTSFKMAAMAVVLEI